jgi:aspartyl-tRNA(Asn)/glutamyl-tRNA(Gln) amidotransferase subunit A
VSVADAERRVEAALGAVTRRNQELNVYLHLDAEGARAAAAEEDAIDAARHSNHDPPPDPHRPLAGMPVCIKDIVDVAGMPTTAGGAEWVRHPDEDATVVERLRDAGAIVIGKGNTNEFAAGIEGRNPHKGDCHNPWDPARMTGGSSSGPAAAVAAGMAEGSVGTDTSGSIRIPAALCGVVGIRPTRSTVPAEGVVPLAWSLDAVGPLAKDVATAALMLDVMAGRPPSPAPVAEVAGMRLGFPAAMLALADDPVAGAVTDAVDSLREQGAEIIDCELPDLRRAIEIHRIVQTTEAATAHAAWFERQRLLYAPEVVSRIEPGYSITAEHYLRAQRHRRLFTRRFAAAMAGLDALVMPTSAVLAPPLDAEEVTIRGRSRRVRPALLDCVAPFSQLDCPIVSVPAGLREGLPVGLQILARPRAEATALRIAAAVESNVGPLRPPAL